MPLALEEKGTMILGTQAESQETAPPRGNCRHSDFSPGKVILGLLTSRTMR